MKFPPNGLLAQSRVSPAVGLLSLASGPACLEMAFPFSFNYLGNIISYKKELDIDNKPHNYLKITGIIINVFRPQKALKKTTIKLHNTLALPVLLYGSETWTVKARDARRITAAEMKYMRRTAGYTWDRLQNKFTHCKGIRNNTSSR